MIHHEELPIGVMMEIARHTDVQNRLAQLSKQEQKPIVDGARNIDSHSEMRSYVESIFK